MKILGIIAEYNPFHKGHKYQLNKAKIASECDAVVVVMSGNYVQRGEPAIIEKYSRAQIAIKNGADLVIELPFPFACQNAELFALSAVAELKKIGVTTISFGCENPNIEILEKVAELQLNNLHSVLFKKFMSEGFSYPQAINNTVKELLSNTSDDTDYSEFELLPNNTLALEYIKAAKKLEYNVEFLPIKRHGAQHNDKEASGRYASASLIRKELLKHKFSKIKKYVPLSTYSTMKDFYKKYGKFNSLDNYFELINFKILSGGKKFIKSIYDVSEGLENKIFVNVYKHNSINEYILAVKSKRYTYARIQRIFLNILLDIKKEDLSIISSIEKSYIKVLASNKIGNNVLKNLKNSDFVPITKFSDFKRAKINIEDDPLFSHTVKSSDIYYIPLKNASENLHSEYIKNIRSDKS